MSHIANKVDAEDKKLNELFSERRYKIDTFQREYRWRRQQVEAMISDLYLSFSRNYEYGDTLADVRQYDCYYMGPVVLCDEGVTLSVIDGQQRLTTLSLLFIYMSHLQKSLNIEEDNFHDLSRYLVVRLAGKKTFVLDVPKRDSVMKFLMSAGNTFDYKFEEGEIKDESIVNILERYDDIENLFPEQLKTGNALSCFIEWLLYRVVMVQITAYSMDNAYTIFETMNDRGLSLSPTEILKAQILAKIENEEESEAMNEFWKNRIAELKYIAGYEGDMVFFRAWFRAKYAETVRSKSIGSENEDFELIGTQFHTWFKNNYKKIGIKSSRDFYFFVKSDFDFFSNVFAQVVQYKNSLEKEHEQFHIVNCYPMADSLYYPLLLSPISKDDSEDEIESKLDIMNGYVDAYVNIRTICHKTITQSSIRYHIYDLIKELRGANIEQLKQKLIGRYLSLKEMLFDSSMVFSSLSPSYMHYFLARWKFYEDHSIELFDSLLRSRKRNSYILARVIEPTEINNLEVQEIQPYLDCLANYCLLNRQKYNDIVSLNVDERVSEILSTADLKRYIGIPMIDFYKTRCDEIKNFIVSQWIEPGIKPMINQENPGKMTSIR